MITATAITMIILGWLVFVACSKHNAGAATPSWIAFLGLTGFASFFIGWAVLIFFGLRWIATWAP